MKVVEFIKSLSKFVKQKAWANFWCATMCNNKETTKQKEKTSEGCKRTKSLSELVKQEAYVHKSFYEESCGTS